MNEESFNAWGHAATERATKSLKWHNQPEKKGLLESLYRPAQTSRVEHRCTLAWCIRERTMTQKKNWLLFEWTLPNALEANKLMALCKRSGLMAWTINTCLRTKTAKLSLITSLCTKPIKTWTYLLKEADLLSYWRWYVLFTLWTALERHPQISAVQLKILVQVCKSVLKRERETI